VEPRHETEFLEKAKQFATEKHKTQFRRDGVTPYIVHPEKVASLLYSNCDKTIAWLHDTIEDTETTYEEIEQMFGLGIAHSVLGLTHKKGETYFNYIRRIRNDNDVIAIKIADIVANLTDKPSEKQIKKYTTALNILADKL